MVGFEALLGCRRRYRRRHGGGCVRMCMCAVEDLITWYPLRSSALVIARPIPFQGPYTLAGRWPSSLSLPPLLPQ